MSPELSKNGKGDKYCVPGTVDFRQVLQLDARPEGLGHVMNFLLDLTIGVPDGFANYTGVEFNVLMSSEECADFDGVADFLDKDTGETYLGYRAYMSKYYETQVLERLSPEVCRCTCGE